MSERPGLDTAWKVAIGAGVVIAAVILAPVVALGSGHFRLFYIPAEAMEPTLKVNDRFVAKMGVPANLNRGDIVLVAVGDSMYVMRLAALPGDTIELVDGIIFLDGREVAQRRVAIDRLPQPGLDGDRAVRLVERFPGEREAHEIYDIGRSMGDDYPRTRVPAGHVFLLGDNRDHSADSRFSRDEMGLGGAVPITDIRGRPWWYYSLVSRGERNSPN
jgi:signal peptidase I